MGATDTVAAAAAADSAATATATAGSNGSSGRYFFAECTVIVAILILPFLYEKSHVFRYHLKFFVYYAVVSFNSVVLIPAFLCRPCDVKNLLLASSFCHHISTLLGLKWELRGKEHLEKDEACIIVANHQSSLDVLGMFDIWPVMNKCTVVAKRELFYAWPFGLAAWLSGLIFIDRMQSDKARNALYKAADVIRQKRIKLWIFPEGTRRNTGTLHAFKKGAFHVAIAGQLPIVPVVFSSYQTFLDDSRKSLNAGNIIVTSLPPIPTVGLTKDDVEDLMNRTYQVMLTQYKLSSAEAQNAHNKLQHEQMLCGNLTTAAAASVASKTTDFGLAQPSAVAPGAGHSSASVASSCTSSSCSNNGLKVVEAASPPHLAAVAAADAGKLSPRADEVRFVAHTDAAFALSGTAQPQLTI